MGAENAGQAETISGLQDVASDQETGSLQLMIKINRDSAARLGVNVTTIQQTLYDAFGQPFITQLYGPLNTYHVVLEVAPQYQTDVSALSRIYVHGAGGQLIPLSQFATLEPTQATIAVNHQGQFPAVTLSFNLAPGVSLGQAVDAIGKAATAIGKPDTVQASFQGTAQEFQASLSTQPMLIVAALFAVYVVLGVLYESFVHPITILLTLPSASVGALFFLNVFGFDLTMMAIIGLIMLIGIVKKNAIMMIDFALERVRVEHKPAEEAIYEACRPALPPDHDDHDVGYVRHASDRHRHRSRLRSPPTSRRRGGRRPHRLAGAHPVHDAGDLPLHGEIQRVGLGSVRSATTVRKCTFGNAG